MERKSIAIPNRRDGTRLRRVDDSASGDSGALASAAHSHVYRVGEQLQLRGGGIHWGQYDATCIVLAQLPREGSRPHLYRVRNEREQFERVVAEADLTRR